MGNLLTTSRKPHLALVALLALSCCWSAACTAQRYGLVIHGGAGFIKREGMTEAREASIRAVLDSALQVGYTILEKGGIALDAVEATIHVLENSPHFNAGKGAVRTHYGTFELDAAVMDGKTGGAGAVAGVRHVKNPISAARLVMERSPHVFLIGSGADSFAVEQGLQPVDSAYYTTPLRTQGQLRHFENEHRYGTVGCVALDQEGNLAAGTSTGGMSGKLPGRVGDAPIIAAGTYAENGVAGVSCTGHGEFFIRNVVAYDICARMKYGGATLQAAADTVLMKKLVALGASGGAIAMDASGNVALPFNTPGMYRGYRVFTPEGVRSYVAMFADE